jgi:uncharacterized protein (DUF2147 family)
LIARPHTQGRSERKGKETMKYLITALTLIATPALAQDATGTWQTERGDTGGLLHVDIAACGDMLCGTIARAFDKDNAQIADYEHIGKQLIWDMSAKGDNAWGSGKIWAPDRDKTYSSKMELNGDRLKVSGCVAAVICRSQTWIKVQ